MNTNIHLARQNESDFSFSNIKQILQEAIQVRDADHTSERLDQQVRASISAKKMDQGKDPKNGGGAKHFKSRVPYNFTQLTAEAVFANP